MPKFKLTYFISIFLLLFVISCNITKNVPTNSYLLKENQLSIKGDKLNEDDLALIIRQQPNRTFLKTKFKLMLYNSVDSIKALNGHKRHYNKVVKKNQHKRERQNRINARRIAKAKAKGKDDYIKRIIPLKDSINIRFSFREWLKYKQGEKPVVFDSLLFQKTIDQMAKYLKKKGYYYGHVSGEYTIHSKKEKQIIVKYTIESGQAYRIDSVIVDCPNPGVKSSYDKFLRKQSFDPITGELFDEDFLDAYRFKVAKFFRDESIYGFSPNNITYEADTNNMRLSLKIIFSDRKVIIDDSVRTVPYASYSVNKVFYHIIDTNNFNGNFKEYVENQSLSLKEDGYLRNFDTLNYNEIYFTKSEVKKRKKNFPGISTEMLNPWRQIYVLYNGKPYIKPALLELQNYLEPTNTYKEYYIERSFNRLAQLEVFSIIKPDVVEVKGQNKIDVHYYVIPSKKQAYSFQQRFTNSNSFLGLSASINYSNKNLFRGSEKLKISFGGGFESQPPVFDGTLDGQNKKSASRSFNTFEIGPSVELDLPGLFLLRKATKLSKRHRPRTVLSAAYNFQKRDDFARKIFQLNYLWKFYVAKTQVVQFGFPAAAIKYVNIKPSTEFGKRLDESNDLFLKNAYSNQFVWENLKVLYEYNNKMSDTKKKHDIVYNASLNSAGLIPEYFDIKDTTETGQKTLFGVAYSRFIRMDNEVIVGYPVSKKFSLHGRSALGMGVPRGNNTTSLPFDYSFFAGGSNDNRGWKARALGPGSYKYYLDTNRTATQIGDIRLGLFAEARYALSSFFKTAIFLDAGNIWTYNDDSKRVGGQFSKDFYREIALSTGFGFRLDFTFLIIRLDFGFPLTNPALPNGSKWVFSSRDAYIQEGLDKFSLPDLTDEQNLARAKSYLPKPFAPQFQFGIGYPF